MRALMPRPLISYALTKSQAKELFPLVILSLTSAKGNLKQMKLIVRVVDKVRRRRASL